MGKAIGYFFMICAGLTLVLLISDLVWMRRTGLMFTFFGQELTSLIVGVYLGSFVSSIFCAWIAFTLDRMSAVQQEIIDRIAWRGTGPLTIRSEPRLMRARAA